MSWRKTILNEVRGISVGGFAMAAAARTAPVHRPLLRLLAAHARFPCPPRRPDARALRQRRGVPRVHESDQTCEYCSAGATPCERRLSRVRRGSQAAAAQSLAAARQASALAVCLPLVPLGTWFQPQAFLPPSSRLSAWNLGVTTRAVQPRRRSLRLLEASSWRTFPIRLGRGLQLEGCLDSEIDTLTSSMSKEHLSPQVDQFHSMASGARRRQVSGCSGVGGSRHGSARGRCGAGRGEGERLRAHPLLTPG